MLKDLFGREIRKGEFFIHIARHSCSLWYNIGIVLDLAPSCVITKTMSQGGNDSFRLNRKMSRLIVTSRIIMVPESSIIPAEYIDILKDEFDKYQGKNI